MKCNIRHKALWLVLAALLLSACSADDASDSPVDKDKASEIRLSANVWRVMEGTRATTYEGGTLTTGNFTCAAYWAGRTDSYIAPTTMTYVTDHWTFDGGSRYWPLPTSNGGSWPALDFFAYMPAVVPSYITDVDGVDSQVTYAAGNPQFKCTVPMTHSGQDGLNEFILAMATDQTKATNSGTVNMEFKHPFARIKFQLSASHPDITINSITFKSLKSGGTCSFNGTTSTWSSLTPSDGTTDFVVTLTGDDAEFNTNPSSPRPIGTDYIMVPQTWSGVIEINADCLFWGDEVNYPSLTTTVPTTWQPGYSYTYTFNISPDDLKVDIENTFTEQW